MARKAVIIIDNKSIIKKFDLRAEKIFGFKAKEAIGKPLDIILPKSTSEIHRALVTDYSKRKPSDRIMNDGRELIGVTKEGIKIPLEISIGPLKEGDNTYFSAEILDISKKVNKVKKETEKNIKDKLLAEKIKSLESIVEKDIISQKDLKESLYNSEMESKLFYKTYPDLVFIMNKAGDIIEFKGGPEGDLFLSPIYFVNKNIKHFFPKEICNKYFTAIKNLTRSKNSTVMNYSLQLEGKDSYFEGKISLLNDDRILFIARNITENVESKNLLERKDILLSAIAKATNVLLTLKDLNLSVNKSLEILGEAVDVDRVYIFENHKDENGRLLMSQINEWCKDPKEAQIDNTDLQNFDYKHVPRWKSLMINGKAVNGLVKTFTKPEREALEPQGIKSLLAIPIYVGTTFWGFVGFDDITKERIWSDTEVEILRSMANIFALHIEQKRTEGNYFNKAKELWILNQIIASANKSNDLSEIFKNVLDDTIKLLNFDGGGIYVLNEEINLAELVYYTGLSKEHIGEIKSIDIRKPPYNKIFIEGVPIFTENYGSIDPKTSKLHSVSALASVPVSIGNKVIGAINVKSSKHSKFTDLQKETIRSVADELSGAIQRRRMLDSLIQNETNLHSFFDTIDDMLFVLNTEGNIIKINKAVQDKLKCTEDELIGQNVLMVHQPEGRVRAQRIVGEMLAGKESSCDVPLISKYGDIIKVETKVKLGKWNNEDVIFGISRDISQRLKMEEELQKSEGLWKYALEGNGDGLWDWNIKTNEVFFSKRWKQMIGYEDNEIENNFDTWKSRIHPDDLDNVFSDVNKHLNGETDSYINEHRLKCKDNSYKWILDRGIIIERDKNEKPVRMLGTHVDISLSKQMEESLQENELRNRAMLDLIPDMLFVMTKNGDYLHYHAPGNAKLYVKPEDFLGKNIRTILSPELANKFLELFDVSARTGQMTFYEYYLDDKELNERNYFEARIITYGDENRVLTIIRDITSRKNYEKKIEDSERKYRYLAENSQDIICLHKLDSTYEFISPSVKTVLGFDDYELIGKTPFESMVEEDASKYSKLVNEKIFENQTTFVFESRRRRKDGSYVWLETVLSPIKDENNKMFRILSASRDITLRKKTEENIRLTLEKEKKLNELKSNFISTTSHEFRTPLSAILSSTELLEFYSSMWTEDKKKDHFQKIKISINNMTLMLNDILSFNKAESNNINFARNETNVYDLCNVIVEDFKTRISAKYKVIYEFKANDRIFSVDSKLLKQALDNLLNNAAKYSPEGSKVKLLVREDTNTLSFLIYDEGMGIQNSDRDKLFEAFYRGKNALLISGTGIGLPLVKRIAELHEGTVTFEDNKPKGTIFKLVIKI
ncbi:MAG: PAS domain S-box protein [Ignavibacteriae bacterium]|nr:PAS domain S-box protein [Ignavibacteriota bacterium]